MSSFVNKSQQNFQQTKFSKYSLFPIRYPKIYDLYKEQRDNFWVPAEVTSELPTDIQHWRTVLNGDERRFLSFNLAFFAVSDGYVMENLGNFISDVSFEGIPEAMCFYGIQQGIEAIHSEMYSIFIETLVSDPDEKARLFDAVANFPCIERKAAWMKKWMSPDRPFVERLVAFGCVEGIFFSSAFASIFYFQKRGLMPGLSLGNRWISRDEGIHTRFPPVLIKELGLKIEESRVHEIVGEAVEIEESYVRDSLEADLIGINDKQMCEYVRFVADTFCLRLDCKKKYGDQNPFDWMSLLSLSTKQNFFEGKVAEYKKPSSTKTFSTDADF